MMSPIPSTEDQTEAWTLEMRDQPAALERLLSLLRRRRVPVETLSVERARPGTLRLVLAVRPPSGSGARIRSEVLALEAVLELRPAREPEMQSPDTNNPTTKETHDAE